MASVATKKTADPETITYLLRDIPVDLWDRVKVKAAADDRSLRSAILLCLKLYAPVERPTRDAKPVATKDDGKILRRRK